jgi:hypothetical protein
MNCVVKSFERNEKLCENYIKQFDNCKEVPVHL